MLGSVCALRSVRYRYGHLPLLGPLRCPLIMAPKRRAAMKLIFKMNSNIFKDAHHSNNVAIV